MQKALDAGSAGLDRAGGPPYTCRGGSEALAPALLAWSLWLQPRPAAGDHVHHIGDGRERSALLNSQQHTASGAASVARWGGLQRRAGCARPGNTALCFKVCPPELRARTRLRVSGALRRPRPSAHPLLGFSSPPSGWPVAASGLGRGPNRSTFSGRGLCPRRQRLPSVGAAGNRHATGVRLSGIHAQECCGRHLVLLVLLARSPSLRWCARC